VVSRPYYHPSYYVSPFVNRVYNTLPTYTVSAPVVTTTVPITRTVVLANKSEENSQNGLDEDMKQWINL